MILAAPPPPPATSVETIAGDHAFAADLYKAAQQPGGNLFLSPASVRIALAMTAAGALGDTESEMRSALHLNESAHQTNTGFRALLSDWAARGTPAIPKDAPDWKRDQLQRDAIELHVVNRLWGQSGKPFLAPFLSVLEKDYRAPLEQLDFAKSLDASVARINAWVAEQTANKIQNLLSVQALSPSTRLVITNAVYFKAAWTSPFHAGSTQPADFFNGAKIVGVPTMQQTAHFAYGEADNAKVLELPYADGSMSMVIVLPNEKDGLGALETSLSGASFDRWLNALKPERVHVGLPKFKTESTFALASALQSLGMKSAFDASAANFGGMDGARDLFIGAVVHKAFIEVNEEGTEAAAATAATMSMSAIRREAPPKEMKVDHPFFFFIRDVKSGSILFAGRIVDPS